MQKNKQIYIKTKKLDAESFKNITKFDKRTNQEQRDAGILVFGL